MTGKKLPALQFYIGDWFKDANLSMCSLATRGFWIELIGAMHELGRSGQITGTAQQIARVCRCTAAEAEEAIAELKQTKTAEVSERSGIFTIINRRMKRDFDKRNQTKKRVKNYRQNKNVTLGNKNVTAKNQNVTLSEVTESNAFTGEIEECNADVTPSRARSSSISTSKTVFPNGNNSREKVEVGGQAGENENSTEGRPKPANPPPKDESQDDYIIRKQLENPKLDVPACFRKYLDFCKKNKKQPKRRYFDEWLENEDVPLAEDFSETDSKTPMTKESAEEILAKKYGGKNAV